MDKLYAVYTITSVVLTAVWGITSIISILERYEKYTETILFQTVHNIILALLGISFILWSSQSRAGLRDDRWIIGLIALIGSFVMLWIAWRNPARRKLGDEDSTF